MTVENGEPLSIDLALLQGDDSAENIARILIKHFASRGQVIVRDKKLLRQYNPCTGIFELLPRESLIKLCHSLKSQANVKMTSYKATVTSRTVEELSYSEEPYFSRVPNAVVCANGVIRLISHSADGPSPGLPRQISKIHFEAMGFSPADKQRWGLPFAYNPAADATLVDKFLLETFPSEEHARLIYELMGVALFGYGTRLAKAVYFQGPGANGKGVLLKLFQALLPEELSSCLDYNELTDDYHRLALISSRLNVVGECGAIKVSAWPWFKAAIAGDRMTARYPQHAPFDFDPQALWLFATNPPVSFGQRGEAVARRFIVIPMERIVPENRRNPDLARQLIEFGGDGLLRRAIEGITRVLARLSDCHPPFVLPEDVALATAQWVGSFDTPRLFAEACIERTDTDADRVPSEQMYAAYCAFCRRSGFTAEGMPGFKQALASLGFRSKKSSQVQWLGVRLRQSGHREPQLWEAWESGEGATQS